MKVRLRLLSGLVAEGVIKDISSSGALVISSLPASLLASVRVEFVSLHAVRRPIAAQVVRLVPGGFAVEWTEFSCEPVRLALRQLARADYDEVPVRGTVRPQLGRF